MCDVGDHRGRGSCAPLPIVGLAVLSLLVEAVQPAHGQESPPAEHAGFIVRKQAPPITEAIEDFERYRDHKAWEKGFAALGKVADAAGDRLVVGADGMAVATPVAVRRELLTLPPDGRQAYRLFFDAKAQALFRQATAVPDDATDAAPLDEVTALRQIVDRYFVTSVGDQAADRLGDALFEAGDFSGAEGCWRLILDNYPDTSLAPAQLSVKRAAALANARLWGAFEAVRADVHDRFAGQVVHVAGHDVDAAKFVDGLATPVSTASIAVDTGAPLAMPASDAPAWQFPLMDADTVKQVEGQLMNFGWGRIAGQITAAVPPVAADDKRLYVDWFGVCLAIDLTTGKLLWRTASMSDVAQAIATAPQQGMAVQPDGLGVVPAGDRVLFVGPPPPSAHGNNGMMIRRRGGSGGNGQLVCLSADTGKVLWSSANGSARNLAFYGPPLLSGSHLYAIGIDGGNDNNNGSGATGAYTLVSVALSDGAVQSRVALGTPQFGTDEYSGQRSSQPPALIELSGKVYVLTNNGAVLAVDPAAGHVDWAFTFAPKVESQDNYYYNFVAAPPALAPGAMLASGSTLFVKELGSSVLYALDLDGPALKWKRPVDEAGGLAALRGGDLVMVGPSVDVLDAETRDLRWSAPVSVATGDVQPAWAGNHVYTFGRRGVHDLVLDDGSDGGPVFRGADRDSSGGAVLRAGNRLITVSRSAITAYPLASQPGAH